MIMQSTQRIIDNIRKVANQMDDILRRDLLDAASRLQEQSDLIERMQSELAQAVSERTPHDYGILRDQRDEARGDAAHWRRIAEHRQKELSALIARPEPSRLEIAAMIFAGGTEETITNAFLAAEELIEHARKTK
jgi:hypothetical protein